MAPPDLCRPLKLESPSGGGTQLDFGPTELSPLQDAIPMAAAYLQSAGQASVDRAVGIDRTGDNLRFTDATTSHVLGELVSSAPGQRGSHNALLDVVHFLEDGPGDGWASGSYCLETYLGLLRTKAVWYATSAMTLPIVARLWTYTGLLVATETTILYDAAGAAVRTVTDTYSYSGLFRTGRTRTWV